MPPRASSRRAPAPGTTQPSALAMVLALAVLAWTAANLVGLSYATSIIRDVRAAATSARLRARVRQLVWALIAWPFAIFIRVIAWPVAIVNRVAGAAARSAAGTWSAAVGIDARPARRAAASTPVGGVGASRSAARAAGSPRRKSYSSPRPSTATECSSRRASTVVSPSSSPPSLNLRRVKPDWSTKIRDGANVGVAQALAALVAMDEMECRGVSSPRALPRRQSVERLVAPACEGEDLDVLCNVLATD